MDSLQLRPRDLQMLRAIHQFRVLKSQDHVQRLFGGSDRIPVRLRQLAEHGYLYRFPREKLSSQYHYALGNQGATYLSNKLDWFPRTKVNWRLKNQRFGKFEHAFMIADAMIAIELATREIPGVRFIPPEEVFTRKEAPLAARTWYLKDRFHSTEKRFRVTVPLSLPGTYKDIQTIYGDWVFGLEFMTKKGRAKTYFFLEADRGGMPVDTNNFRRSSIVQKMLVYLEAGKGKKSVNRATGEIRPIKSMFEKMYGIKKIKTLFFIKPTEGGEGLIRIKDCIQTCKKITDGKGSDQFLFAPASWPESPTLLTDLLLDGTGSSMSLLPKVSEPVAR